MKKNILWLFVLAFSLILNACSDDDGSLSVNFKDQPAQGQINGEAWTIGSGTAEMSADEISIDLYSNVSQASSPCDIFIDDYAQAFFSIPKKVGKYDLNISLINIQESQTVTFFVPEGTINIVASKGAVEILSISETEVTGRMDVRHDNETGVNGNFTLTVCE